MDVAVLVGLESVDIDVADRAALGNTSLIHGCRCHNHLGEGCGFAGDGVNVVGCEVFYRVAVNRVVGVGGPGEIAPCVGEACRKLDTLVVDAASVENLGCSR